MPPWIVKPGEKFRYVMPALIDDEDIDISVKAARPDSKLVNCRCFIFTREKYEILLDVPEDWL